MKDQANIRNQPVPAEFVIDADFDRLVDIFINVASEAFQQGAETERIAQALMTGAWCFGQLGYGDDWPDVADRLMRTYDGKQVKLNS